ncbi:MULTISPECIES: hypothetical protein [unclassified Sphingomonas]|uniref:hypothetical protein n=1 Tax=unclassified Sphingomonas TaxID=196159 RepID=UPI0006F291AF|nr:MULTISPECIES: hypothetical protein [unclassified Sphingomonas]KQX20281.1 hypothetical protein ASD17_10485 [Sphingomonas sp. Root1294]KQY67531.1 hypothetical protein ASD39_10545 [Sphingomonas sp. Root50]KRB90908.1 hypothetical protein ASE22_11550 [Sphingomonas sp. Root720]
MKIRTGAGLAAMLFVIACARGEDAHPIENAATVEETAAEDAIDDVDPTGNVSASSLPTDAWVGKWIGVEGLVLDIQPAGERGHYMLSVTLLDGTKSYEGTADGDMIRFTRNGRPESIRAATGDQTGLKWLAGKKNCLMIQQGEGFCREDADAAPAGGPAPQPGAEPAARP